MKGLGRGLLLALFIIVAFAALSTIIQTFIDGIIGAHDASSAYILLAIIFVAAVGAAAIVGGISIRKVLKKFK